MLSNVHPVVARTSGVYGYIELQVDDDGGIDVAAPHRAQLALWVEDLDSGNDVRDLEMMRRLDVRTHPTIEWAVRDVARRTATRYRGLCDVTVHGQTRSVEAEFTIGRTDGRLVVEGEQSFDMRDFGLVPPRFFWLWMEPELTVRVRIVAREVGVLT